MLIQPMVAAERAGVAFSADPVRGDRDRCLVSAVRGLGDKLVDGTATRVPPDTTVAAALGNAGRLAMRRSVTGEPRGPVCGMGTCFECRVKIDGVAEQRSCRVLAEEGMVDIITSLSMHHHLKRLHLDGNHLSKNGCVALATLLRCSAKELQNLSISNTEINMMMGLRLWFLH